MLKIIFNFAGTTSHNYSYDIQQLSEFIKSVYTQNTAIDTILKLRIIESCRLKHLTNFYDEASSFIHSRFKRTI